MLYFVLLPLNSNLINLGLLRELNTVDAGTDVDVPILFNGYFAIRSNFTTNTGYAMLTIKNENGTTIFTYQLNCATNTTYAYDSPYIPVKSGWYFMVTGSNITNLRYKFTRN